MSSYPKSGISCLTLNIIRIGNARTRTYTLDSFPKSHASHFTQHRPTSSAQVTTITPGDQTRPPLSPASGNERKPLWPGDPCALTLNQSSHKLARYQRRRFRVSSFGGARPRAASTQVGLGVELFLHLQEHGGEVFVQSGDGVKLPQRLREIVHVLLLARFQQFLQQRTRTAFKKNSLFICIYNKYIYIYI